jgi:hypothetical protein
MRPREQRRQKRDHIDERQAASRQLGFELLEVRLVAVPRRETKDLTQMFDDRIQSAIGVVRGAAQDDARRALAIDSFVQRLDETRFANPCLATQQHDLSVPLPALQPPVGKQRELRLASHEGHEPTRVQLHAAGARGDVLTHDSIERDGSGDSLQMLRSEGVDREMTVHQSKRRLTDHHCGGLGTILHPSDHVRRIS